MAPEVNRGVITWIILYDIIDYKIMIVGFFSIAEHSLSANNKRGTILLWLTARNKLSSVHHISCPKVKTKQLLSFSCFVIKIITRFPQVVSLFSLVTWTVTSHRGGRPIQPSSLLTWSPQLKCAEADTILLVSSEWEKRAGPFICAARMIILELVNCTEAPHGLW